MNYNTRPSRTLNRFKSSTRQVRKFHNRSKCEYLLIALLCLGVATLKIRVPSKTNGTKLLNLKIKLTEHAKNLQELIAIKLGTTENKVRIIANGKVLDQDKPLDEQGVKNNKQIMALVSDDEAGATVEDPYARIRKIRSEAEILLKNKNSGFFNVSFSFT